MTDTILRVAVPSPLRRSFDYLPPADCPAQALRPGVRVRVPFGRREVIGVLLAVAGHSDLPAEQLKPAAAVLDREPVLSTALLNLLTWAADYYQHPPGEALQQALPVLLRKGEPAHAQETRWRLSGGLGLPEGALKRSPRQAEALALLQRAGSLNEQDLQTAGLKREHLRALEQKQLVERFEASVEQRSQPPQISDAQVEAALTPSAEQQRAIDAVREQPDAFRCFLLEGVTGSGKTEVYLQLIAASLQRGRQTLVLVPEIGLTPQTLARFQRRLPTPIAVLHSGLNDSERLHAWRMARSGRAGVILGTRSAALTDCAALGLIIVDEEHDTSYKQQDGFRYHARDVAIKRARDAGIPILLGSATPSLESLHNALSGRYSHLTLRNRAGDAAAPRIEVLDIRRAPLNDGLAPAVQHALGETLARGEQALVFLNRRGFAPALLCHGCGWIAQCLHCDARLTVHIGQHRLLCHHCGHAQPLPRHCPQCQGQQLEFRGPGTERLEGTLRALLPGFPVIRIDRDTTSRKHALRDLIQDIRGGGPCVLIGTQMLAKGHHFPDVTLVVMVDVDGGLFCADFRGPERMGQVLTQVAGRAGRAQKAGRVLIQTHYPDHPLIQSLTRDGYDPFARGLLDERRQGGMPPFGHLALVRADARDHSDAETLLADLRALLDRAFGNDAVADALRCFGPLPAPMARRAGMFRAQLLLQARQRGQLHRALDYLCAQAEQHPLARRAKWSVDVDPVDLS